MCAIETFAKRRADDFIKWVGDNHSELTAAIFPNAFNYDIFNDTIVHIYNRISKNGILVLNPKMYFLRSYYNVRLSYLRKEQTQVKRFINIVNQDFNNGWIENIPGQSYKNASKITLNIDLIIAHIHNLFDKETAIVFEMYILMQPSISYARLGAILGKSKSFVGTRVLEVMNYIKDNKTLITSL